MPGQLMNILACSADLLAGGIIGAGFGMVQDAARRRNEKRQETGALKNAWTVMPGSGARVAFLLIALVLVQFLCPLLFSQGTQWFVSAGVMVGYGVMLFRQLRQRQSHKL
jgi:hypothetical protein